VGEYNKIVMSSGKDRVKGPELEGIQRVKKWQWNSN
jgi:hypothetical protein